LGGASFSGTFFSLAALRTSSPDRPQVDFHIGGQLPHHGHSQDFSPGHSRGGGGPGGSFLFDLFRGFLQFSHDTHRGARPGLFLFRLFLGPGRGFGFLPRFADDDEHLPHLDRLSLGRPQLQDDPFPGRGDVHYGFVRLQLDETLALLEGITDFDQPFDDFALGQSFA
jgi:hypothetical protein